jgi:hypothetical protein
MDNSTVPTNHPRRQENCRNQEERQVTLLAVSPDGSKNTNEIGQEHANDESPPRESYDPYSSPVQELHRTRGYRKLIAHLDPMQDDYDIFRRQRFAELFQTKLQGERARGATLPALPCNEPY